MFIIHLALILAAVVFLSVAAPLAFRWAMEPFKAAHGYHRALTDADAAAWINQGGDPAKAVLYADSVQRARSMVAHPAGKGLGR